MQSHYMLITLSSLLNRFVGAYVMTVHASDPGGGAFTFALAPATTPFTINATTGVITVRTPSAVDREVNIKSCKS